QHLGCPGRLAHVPAALGGGPRPTQRGPWGAGGGMRIALVCPYAWDSPGGVQLQVRGLAAHLRERGHDTMVIAPSARNWPERGVTIVGRPVKVPFNGSIAPICPDPRSRPRIRAALREFAPDVVHVHEPFVPSTSLFAALSSPAPVVATFHSYMEKSLLLTAA